MKIGFFTDLHAKADTPEGRTDDYRAAILGKLEEIGQIWQNEEVDYVLFGADLFHTPDPALSTMNDVMRVMRSWNKDIYSTVGSHDYFGFQAKTLKRTALGFFQTSGVLELIDAKEGVLLKRKDFARRDPVFVSSTPHDYWLADDPKNLFKASPEKRIDLHIQLVHGDLLDKPVPWKHILVEQVETEADLILSGHYHPGWKSWIDRVNTATGKIMTFVNPGSIARLENTGRQRTPRVCIIEVAEPREGSRGFALKFVPLTTCAPHPFKEKLEEKEGSTMQDITKLMQLIEATQVEAVDIKAVLPMIAKEVGIGDDVLEKAFTILDQV